MKSKRLFILAIALVGLLIITSALVGCGTTAPQPSPKAEAPKAPAPAPAAGKQIIRWGTSSVGSTGYNLSAKMADIVNKNTNYDVNITPVGGAEATIRAIARGEREIGFGNTHAAYDGYNGVGGFAKEGKQPVLLVAMTYTSTLTLVAQPGINSVADFKGKTVTYRRGPNPLFNVFGDAVLKAYGLDPDKDVKNVTTAELREITDGLKTGSIEVGLIPGSIPGATIPELMEAKPFVVIDLGKDKVEGINKASPFMMPFPIKANTFKNQTKDVNTMGFVNVIFAKADLPDKVIYDITKAIFTRLDELAGADPVAKAIKLENAPKDAVIPLHPGAIQFYKEAGVLK